MRNFTILITTIAILFYGCKRDDALNLSPVSSISTDMPLGMLTGAVQDQTGKFVFLLFQDVFGATQLKKIRLSNLEPVASYKTADYIQIDANLAVNKDNQIFINSYAGYHLINKFDSDLNPLGSDTTGAGSTILRKAFCTGSDGNVYYAANLQDTNGRFYVRFAKMNDDVRSTIILEDTVFKEGITFFPRKMIPTPDGGFIISYRTQSPPLSDVGLAFEKRDAQFKLVWRQRYDPPGTQSYGALALSGNQLVVTGINSDVSSKTNFFGMKYDENGYLLWNKSFTTGAIDEKRTEPMVATEDGGFMFTALTSATTGINQRKGVLYKVDAEFNVVKSQIFGGQVGVTSSIIMKITPNDYLLSYMDNGFKPDGSNYRLVMQHVDGNGNFIE